MTAVSAAVALGRTVGTFVDALGAAGVSQVCACPGSRSTPLAIELARQHRVKLWMHLDERSAAYFGLGLARASGQPVALLATSGTAAANFFPAIVEANLARVPLVVLTADRPHELRDNGAPQTIDQLRLYGQHVKWFADLPEPDGTDRQRQLVSTLATRAVATSRAEPRGPVHLNWPFRDPLIPAHVDRTPATRVAVRHGQLAPDRETVTSLTRVLGQSKRGLIVAGPQDDAQLADALVALARRLKYPILADPLSGVRRGPHVDELVIDTYDAFLRDPSVAASLEPELVVRFGAIPTSKVSKQFLERAQQIVVDPGGWREPSNAADEMLHIDPRLLSDVLVAELVEREGDDDWCQGWRAVNAAARRAIDAHFAAQDELFEGKAFSELAELLPDGAVLYAGNSMPVRDLDTFLPRSRRRLRCLANRGANGIDGVVSSALGASAAIRGDGPVVLVIGDVSLYHDLNGLLAARQHKLDLLVVLLNNDGGGIFSFLPQAEVDGDPEEFERLFGTPHGLDFRPFVEGYGGRFTRVDNWTGFNAAVSDAFEQGGLQVVEVPTNRARNVEQHRAVWRAVSEALRPVAVAS